MANAKRDDNYLPTAIGVLNTDGSTPTLLEATAATNVLDVDDDTSGSDNGGSNAVKDDNRVSTLMATSEADGVTPVALYVDSSGNLLIDST